MNTDPNKLYFADIARDLTTGIASGRYPVGSLLPTELALCKHYATSRHTVRAALHALQKLGLVSRRKNVGTHAATDRLPVDWTDVYVAPELGAIAELVRTAPSVLISTLIETRYGNRIAEISQEIRATTLSEPLAASLQVPAGTAALLHY